MATSISETIHNNPFHKPPNSNDNVADILDRAATQHITANELNVLVNKTRELSHIREQELKHLQALLADLEERLDPSHH